MADLCDDADGGAHEVTVIPQHSGVPEYLCMLSFAIRGIELAKVVAPELVFEAATELASTLTAPDASGGGESTTPKKGRGRKAASDNPAESEYDANRVILGVTEDRPRPPGQVYAEHHANVMADKAPGSESELTPEETAIVAEYLAEHDKAAGIQSDGGASELPPG